MSDHDERRIREIVRDELREVCAAAKAKAQENRFASHEQKAAAKDAIGSILAAVDERSAPPAKVTRELPDIAEGLGLANGDLRKTGGRPEG